VFGLSSFAQAPFASTGGASYLFVVAENIDLAESTTQSSAFLLSITEDTVLDDVDATAGDYFGSIIEAITIEDTPTIQAAFAQSVNEDSVLADAAEIAAQFAVVRNEDAVMAEGGVEAMRLDASGNLNMTGGGTANTANTFGFKNRLINGAMPIFQRGTVATANNQYSVDRWAFVKANDAIESVSQNADAPAGFTNSLRNTISTGDASIGASQYSGFEQRIEGFNVADLAWGTANAKTVTLSFWVRSSLTGTFGGSIQNSAGNRSYPFTYTINSANTWEYETITIAGDTSGTWLTTNGVGLRVWISVGAGSSSSGTAGAWSGSDFRSATGATSVVGTNGATFYITGVQLEVGSTATSFDYRPYGTELALCQRYCVVFTNLGGGARFGSGYYNSSTTAFNTVVPIGTPLRDTPSVTASNMTIGIQGAAPSVSSISGISYAANIPSVNFISNTGTTKALGSSSGSIVLATFETDLYKPEPDRYSSSTLNKIFVNPTVLPNACITIDSYYIKLHGLIPQGIIDLYIEGSYKVQD